MNIRRKFVRWLTRKALNRDSSRLLAISKRICNHQNLMATMIFPGQSESDAMEQNGACCNDCLAMPYEIPSEAIKLFERNIK